MLKMMNYFDFDFFKKQRLKFIFAIPSLEIGLELQKCKSHFFSSTILARRSSQHYEQNLISTGLAIYILKVNQSIKQIWLIQGRHFSGFNAFTMEVQ
jgi:hypothetical protein